MHPGTMLTDAIRAWPTPRAEERLQENSRDNYVALSKLTERWPTPTAMDSEQAGGVGATGRTRGPSLHREADAWPTPQNRSKGGGDYADPEKAAARLADGVHQRNLSEVALTWPTWATPNVPNGGRSSSDSNYKDGKKRQIDLGAQTSTWATPRAEDAECCGNHPGASDSLTGQTRHWKTPHGFANTDQYGRTGGGGGEFHKQAMAWQTPGTDSFRSRSGDRKDEPGLDQQARVWPTPAVEDSKMASPETYMANRLKHLPGRTTITSLTVMAEHDAAQSTRSFRPDPETPRPGDEFSLTTQDLRPPSPSPQQWRSPNTRDHHAKGPRLGAQRQTELVDQIQPKEKPSAKAKLNPEFVGWLMGYPPAWISYGPTATALSRWRSRMRSSLWALVRGSGD